MQPRRLRARTIGYTTPHSRRHKEHSFTPMYDYSRQTPYGDIGSSVALGQRSAVLGKVIALLGFSFVFTAGGALIGRGLGPGAFLISLIGSFGTLIALQFLRERSPLNLALLRSEERR